MRDLLFLQHRPVDEWRAMAANSHSQQYERVLAQARRYLDQRPPVEHPDDSITYIGAAVANLGLAFLLSQDEALLYTLREWARIAIGYPHWGKHRKPDHDLDAAWLLFGLSLAYDWLKSELPPAEVDALRAKLIRQGRELYRYAKETKGAGWGSTFWQNHNWICYAGLATAGYALRDDLAEAETWCEAALENFETVFELLPDDGSDYEGPVYWRYGVPWLLIADDLFGQQQGASLHRRSGFLENTFYFRLYLAGPNLVDTANLGDCHDRRSAHSKAILYRLASLYRNGYAQWLAEHFDRTGEWEREAREGLVKPGLGPEAFLEFLWFDPSVTPTDIRELPLQRTFSDLGLVSVRTGWDDQATTLVFKCGQPSGHKAWHYGHALNRTHSWDIIRAGHAHPDENGFILVRGADYLAVDEGYDRNCYSRYHSTVLVDGQGQYHEGGYDVFQGLGPEWGGRLEASFGTGSLAYMRGEAARAYRRDLKLRRFTREMVFLDGETVVIRDIVRSDVPHRYEWLLQTDAPPETVSDHRFRVRVGETEMMVHACAPEPVRHRRIVHEIAANPTSAKPDWILRHTQHVLALEPDEPTREAEFLIALDMAGSCIQPTPCESGVALCSTGRRGEWLIGFGREASGISMPGFLETDARWLALCERDHAPQTWIGGELTLLWWRERPLVIADAPVEVCMQPSASQIEWTIQAPRPTWVSLWVPSRPDAITAGSERVPFGYRDDLSLVRLSIPAGQTVLRAHLNEVGGKSTT